MTTTPKKAMLAAETAMVAAHSPGLLSVRGYSVLLCPQARTPNRPSGQRKFCPDTLCYGTGLGAKRPRPSGHTCRSRVLST